MYGKHLKRTQRLSQHLPKKQLDDPKDILENILWNDERKGSHLTLK